MVGLQAHITRNGQAAGGKRGVLGVGGRLTPTALSIAGCEHRGNSAPFHRHHLPPRSSLCSPEPAAPSSGPVLPWPPSAEYQTQDDRDSPGKCTEDARDPGYQGDSRYSQRPQFLTSGLTGTERYVRPKNLFARITGCHRPFFEFERVRITASLRFLIQVAAGACEFRKSEIEAPDVDQEEASGCRHPQAARLVETRMRELFDARLNLDDRPMTPEQLTTPSAPPTSWFRR